MDLFKSSMIFSSSSSESHFIIILKSLSRFLVASRLQQTSQECANLLLSQEIFLITHSKGISNITMATSTRNVGKVDGKVFLSSKLFGILIFTENIEQHFVFATITNILQYKRKYFMRFEFVSFKKEILMQGQNFSSLT